MFRSQSFTLLAGGVLTLFCLSTLPTGAQINFTPFVTSTGGSPISISYGGDKFVGSNYFSNQLYSTDLNGGNVQPFGPTFFSGGDPGNGEHFVASSLGVGGFPNHDFYIGVGNYIDQIDHNGTTVSTFVSGLKGTVRGILFDSIGTFGHDMLVTTSTGDVYRVNSAGSVSHLANVGEDVEGIDVAPLGGGFGAYDGQLIVASEGSGNIRAITTTGTISLVANVPSAEELTFVPLNLGSSGNPVEGFYGADYSVDVIKAGTSQFTSYLGDAIVTGETTHEVSDIHFDGTNFVVTHVGMFPNQPEDGIFVTAAIINTVPEPGSVALLVGMGLSGAGFLARRRKQARQAA